MRGETFGVALSSLLWAVLLTATKLIAGLVTGSIGVLSEALHSALDLVAAAITVFAVSQSAKPADRDHQFGHGKYENLSALFETLLLVGTSGWILVAAVGRLLDPAFAGPLVSPWSFAVMFLSIAVDAHRSRALLRAARKHHSQALKADALHFSSDILSSVAVLLGLGASALGFPWADPVAAVAVGLVILGAASRLIRQSVNDLLDRAPEGVSEAITELVRHVPGVEVLREVRVRPQGKSLHVDVVLGVDGAETLARAHQIADSVEDAVRAAHPEADVNVHVEPCRTADKRRPA